MPELLLLSGPPGAGKTSAALALAERYDRVAHVEVDTLRHFITPTGFIAAGRPGFERQYALAVRNACCLARNFLAERIAVIIDDVVPDRAGLELYVSELGASDIGVHFVRLLPSLDVCLQRNAAREQGRVSPRRLRSVWQEFAEAKDVPGVTLDNGALSVYETADRLQALTTSGESLVVRPS